MAESYTVPYYAPISNPYLTMFKCDKTIIVPPLTNWSSSTPLNTFYTAFTESLNKKYTFCLIFEGCVSYKITTGQNPDYGIGTSTIVLGSLTSPTPTPRVILNGNLTVLGGNCRMLLNDNEFKIEQYYQKISVSGNNPQTYTGAAGWISAMALIGFFE